MAGAVLAIGDKLHIMARRLFEEDMRRHFVGEVIAFSDYLAELRGYTFIFQEGTNEYCRLPEIRHRLFSLGEAGYIVNKIPREVDLAAVVYRFVENRRIITDDDSFTLAINEFGTAS